MKLTTQVSIPEFDFRLSHKEPIFTIGSCFSVNIGKQLIEHGFKVSSSEMGTLFNPVSIQKILKRVLENSSDIKEDKVIQENGLFHHFDFPSTFSDESFDKLKDNIKSKIQQHHHFFNTTKTIIVTFGTAWVYELENSAIVASCHKVPQNNFSKKLLSVEKIVNDWNALLDDLKNYNIIFTLSPVRHQKDGFIENLRSKSILCEAIHQLVENNLNIHYFPAYEIVMDELRDYRFYKNDLLHPNELAIEYIFEKFSHVLMDQKTKEVGNAYLKLKQLLNHRPIHKSKEQEFIKQQKEAMNLFIQNYGDELDNSIIQKLQKKEKLSSKGF